MEVESSHWDVFVCAEVVGVDDVVVAAGFEVSVSEVDGHFGEGGDAVEDDAVVFSGEDFVGHGFVDEFFVYVEEEEFGLSFLYPGLEVDVEFFGL